MPNADEFRQALTQRFQDAIRQRRAFIELSSGEFHRALGGYPAKGHAMPTCCSIMRREYERGRAEIVSEPPKRAGASLKIRYQLPR